MEKTTTELTQEYIKEHPFIKSCLKKGLLNYSALSRHIAKELNIEKKTSKEAILIAARRLHETLKKEKIEEQKIKHLLSYSEIEIRNKIIVLIIDKNIHFELIEQIQKSIKKESGIFYILEGSDNYTLITQEKFSPLLEEKLKSNTIKKHYNLALIMLKSSKEIEQMVGVLSYLTSLFSENGVNIIEFLSCWTDTLFIINSEDIPKTLSFLKFSPQQF